jgi:subtilase family serine protease
LDKGPKSLNDTSLGFKTKGKQEMMSMKLLHLMRFSRAASASMVKSKIFTSITAAALFAAAIITLCGALATPAKGTASTGRRNLGPENPSAAIEVRVWLKLHNEAALDSLVQQMYDKSSPNYHHWLTKAEYQSKFAPTAADAKTVADYLQAHNLKVMRTNANDHFVVAQGTVGDAQKAFSTEIDRIEVNGQVHRVAQSKPTASGAAAQLIAAVQGMSEHGYFADVSRAKDPETGKPYAGASPFSPGPDGLFFSADCLRPPQTVTFTTGGGFPKATYSGNRYGANITNKNPPNLAPCGYDAAEIQTAYGLNQLFNQGLDGTGQTIVIVDAFGSNTILPDANLFSQLNGLPPLRVNGPNPNFEIVRPTGPTHCGANNGCIGGNWQFETTLDVEWAHAVAPNAKIVLVVAADNQDATLDEANLFAVENLLGGVISNSFGLPEIVLVEEAPQELEVENQIAKIAASFGISLQNSTGDSGDNLALDTNVFGIPVTSPGAIADSPFVTAVGGTSTFLEKNNTIKLQTGWGLNLTRIAEPTPNPPDVPPLISGFQDGAGGGTSVYFKKPAFQSQLRGGFRKQPDIAMNADPQTGNEIIVTPDSVRGHPQEVAVFGGTSLSCPMFSALWAIANQAAEKAGLATPIGLAAPILYQLPAGAIRDVNVTAAETQHNVSGTVFNPPNPPQHFSPRALAEPQENTGRYVSALYNSPFSTRWFVFTFGTDSSLNTAPGWDDVTGLGTPVGQNFVNAVVSAVK